MGSEETELQAASMLLGPAISGIGGAPGTQSPEAMAMLRAAVQAAQAVGIDPAMALAHMPLLPAMMGGASNAAAVEGLSQGMTTSISGLESDATTISGDSPPAPQDGSLSIDGLALPVKEELPAYGTNSFRRTWLTLAAQRPDPVSDDLLERQGRWRQKSRKRKPGRMVSLYRDPKPSELLLATYWL